MFSGLLDGRRSSLTNRWWLRIQEMKCEDWFITRTSKEPLDTSIKLSTILKGEIALLREEFRASILISTRKYWTSGKVDLDLTSASCPVIINQSSPCSWSESEWWTLGDYSIWIRFSHGYLTFGPTWNEDDIARANRTQPSRIRWACFIRPYLDFTYMVDNRWRWLPEWRYSPHTLVIYSLEIQTVIY
jgi:hypothetical protein